MTPLKILTVVGTRPEAIKRAPVILELARRAAAFESRVCATGQHRQMLDQVLTVFGIVPDEDLARIFHKLPAERRLGVGFAAWTRLKPVANRRSTLSALRAACELSRLGLEAAPARAAG